MKKFLLPLVLIFCLVACKQPRPAETARQFVKNLYLLDYERAAALATADTKKTVDRNNLYPVEQNAEARSRQFARNDFMLDSLRETMAGNTAIVESDGIALSLVKENNAWKVKVSGEMLDAILNRKEKNEEVQIKWELLQRAFENRMQAAKEYVQFQSQAGSLTAGGQGLLELITQAVLPEKFTKNQQEAYILQQAEIEKLIEKTVVPTYTAGADFSMNLIIRINEAGNHIQKAKEEYNAAAKGLRSPVYLPEIR